MSVSVVIPAYNSRHVKEAIGSIFAQAVLPSEVIVVDSSPDSTLAAINGDRGRINYYYQPPRGVSAARNFGIRKATGKFVALLDADDVWLPGKLEKQIALLELNPQIGFSFSTVWNLLDMEQEGIPNEPFFPPALRRWMEKGLQHEGAVSGRVYELLLDVNCIATSSLVIRRDVFEKVAPFNETLNNGEDYEFELRLAREFPALFINEPTTRYRVHGTGLSGAWSARSDLFYQTNLKVLEKHHTLHPSVFVRRAIARTYAAYALHCLKAGKHELAVDSARRSLGIWPSVRAFKCYAEATSPKAYKLMSAWVGSAGRNQSKS
jgi:glycosyltransferase involved in cell wall biosynthesis